MDRRAAVDRLMRALADGSAIDLVSTPWSDTAFGAALTSVAAFWVGDFRLARDCAAFAVDGATDTDDRALALAAQALARAGDLESARTDRFSELLQILAHERDDTMEAVFMRYLATEAALCSARIGAAARLCAGGIDPTRTLAGHPFDLVVQVCEIRTATFAGQIGEADTLLRAARVRASGRLVPLLGAIEALVGGNADDAERTRRWVIEEQCSSPADFLTRGRLLLLAYGAVAIGDARGAAALVLRAGGDSGLHRMTIIDRAWGLEMLFVAAQIDGDQDAMAAWVAEAEVLAAHPISAPTIGRLHARAALAAGHLTEAIRLAERSVADSRRDARLVEAAESELVLARARIGLGDLSGASRRLRTLVNLSDSTGHHAVRREAGRALGSARRRLPPIVGGGWPVLSSREVEVGQLILAGYDTREIARRLSLSPHTVRVHTSRVLAAFGVASRVALLAREGARGDVTERTAPLTPRQNEVVRLMSSGQTNEQIARTLGISVRTVEKHLGDALVRWDVPTRFELARLWLLCTA